MSMTYTTWTAQCNSVYMHHLGCIFICLFTTFTCHLSNTTNNNTWLQQQHCLPPRPTNNNTHLQQQHHSPPHSPPQCEWPNGHVSNVPFGPMVILLFLYFFSGTDCCQLSTTTIAHLSLHTSTALTSTIGMARTTCSNMLFGPWYIILKNVIFSIFLTFFFSFSWPLSHNTPNFIPDELHPHLPGPNNVFEHVVWAPGLYFFWFYFLYVFDIFFLVFPGHSHMMHPTPSPTCYIHISRAMRCLVPGIVFFLNFLFLYVSDVFLVLPGHPHMTHPTPSPESYIHISQAQTTLSNALFGPRW